MLASVFLSSLALGLTACGPRVADRNIDALNKLYEASERSGKTLTIKEVESVLGAPQKVEQFPIEMQTTKELPGVRYYYKQNGQTIVLHFMDNQLIQKVQHFGDPEDKDAGAEEADRHKMPPRPAKQ